MKNIIFIFLFISMTNTYGQQAENSLTTKEVITSSFPCYETKDLFGSLKNYYKEVPIIFGKSDDVAKSVFSLWLNGGDKTFTLVATVDTTSCVVGSGTDFKIVPKELLNRR